MREWVIASRERQPMFPLSWGTVVLGMLAAAGVAAGWGILNYPTVKVLAVALGVLCIMLAAWKIDLALYIVVLFLVVIQEAETAPGTLFALLERINRPNIPSLLEALLAAVVAAFVFRHLLGIERYSFREMRLPIALFMLLLFISFALGVQGGFHKDLIKEDLKRFLFPVLFFPLVYSLLTSRRKIERVLLLVFGLMLLKTVMGIYYYFTGRGFPYGESRVLFLESGDQLIMVTAIVVGFSLMAAQRHALRQWLFMAWGVAPFLIGLVFSYRRNAMWGAIFSCFFLFFLIPGVSRRRLAIYLAGAAFAGACVMAAVPMGGSGSTAGFLAQRLTSVVDRDQSSNRAHVNEWIVTIQDTIKSPVFGLGLGSSHAPVPEFEIINRHTVHNAFLMIWMKMGTIALLLFVWCFYRYFMTGLRGALQTRDPLLTGLFATCALWFVAMNVGPTWFYYRESCLMAMVMAMVLRLAQLQVAENQPSRRRCP